MKTLNYLKFEQFAIYKRNIDRQIIQNLLKLFSKALYLFLDAYPWFVSSAIKVRTLCNIMLST